MRKSLFSFSVRILPAVATLTMLTWITPSYGHDSLVRLRIVFEFSSGEKSTLQTVMSDIDRLQRNSGALSEITIVAVGGGVGLFQISEENDIQTRLAQLVDGGVDLVVCEASLDSAEISSREIIDFARLVKVGSKELERLEAQGWTRVPEGESYVSHL